MIYQKDQLSSQEIVPGYKARVVHTDRMTIVFWDIDSGAELPEHSHEHEQVVQVMQGTFELVINGQVQDLHPGDVVVIPGNVPHSGKALTACVLQDTFAPVREDFTPSEILQML